MLTSAHAIIARMKNRRAVYADLYQLPPNVNGEIIDGELYVSQRPASPHAVAATMMGTDIVGPFGRKPGGPLGPGGWWILFEPELHFGEDVLIPDFAGWRHERMPRVPSVPGFTLAPDWLCEVASPSTARLDRAVKLPVYAQKGITHVWLVDPLARTLEVLRLESGRYSIIAVHSANDRVRAEPFEAVELDLARWWLEEEEPLAAAAP